MPRSGFSVQDDAFTIEDFNRARAFASFLPGIAGEQGKPLWVFYANRGQCIAGFGVRNKNSAMLEFRPADQAYLATPTLGFRTFLRFKSALVEPFHLSSDPRVQQRLFIRPWEIEIE